MKYVACTLGFFALFAGCANSIEEVEPGGPIEASPELMTLGTSSGVLSATLTSPAARGRVTCAVADGAATTIEPMAELPLEVGGRRVVTREDGTFDVAGSFSTRVTVRAFYDGTIVNPVSPTWASAPLRIVDELGAARGETLTMGGAVNTKGKTPVVELNTLALAPRDCELWRVGRLVLRHFIAVRNAAPPSGELRIERQSDVHFTTPYTFYNHVVLATDYATETRDRARREDTLFHEFGHTVRHVADGPEDHWNWDNFRWFYARSHSGDEIFNTQYAFNEGWADYWAAARLPSRPRYASPHAPTFRDWNEHLIANRLLQLSEGSGVGDRMMVETLQSNPGTIHSLFDFESRLNAHLGRLPPPTPAACPPGFHDDGATCRQGGDVIAKPSYGRGVGSLPTQCGAGNEYDGGLCYPKCAPGYAGGGPVCWQVCPDGYNNDGAFCRRDGQIMSSDNSRCPGYDLCGLTFARGCSVCPTGFNNDGCTCRRDPDIFAKSSYGRGVGWVPNACAAGADYDGGLCYTPCASGYHGGGPVCWGSCPAGWIDDAALCRMPLNILVKY